MSVPQDPATTPAHPIEPEPESEPAQASEAPAETTAIDPTNEAGETPEVQTEPASEPVTVVKADSSVRISLLLSTGNRHPFTINNKFLLRHSIQAADGDPWNIKVYDMKTLIWHEWLGEWETRPTSPALIRLIFLGGLLDDKAALKDCRLSKTEPNVVHMTVKPQDLLEDDEVKGKEPKQGSTRQRRSGNCCVIL